jgi:adenylosuccinate lyase
MRKFAEAKAIDVREASRFTPVDFRLGIQWLVTQNNIDLAQALAEAGLALYPRSEDILAIGGLLAILRGHLTMVASLAGDQWNEGDVSCSVVRRVALPDAVLAIDGLFETFLTVLADFGSYPAVIERELDRYLPFLATTKVLVAAVRNGVGREQAHEAIKEHAVAAALRLRQDGAEGNDLIERLAADPRLGLAPDELAGVLAHPIDFVGRAPEQVASFVATVSELVAKDPAAAGYRPVDIL